jgi:hypothetical protein
LGRNCVVCSFFKVCTVLAVPIFHVEMERQAAWSVGCTRCVRSTRSVFIVRTGFFVPGKTYLGLEDEVDNSIFFEQCPFIRTNMMVRWMFWKLAVPNAFAWCD